MSYFVSWLFFFLVLLICTAHISLLNFSKVNSSVFSFMFCPFSSIHHDFLISSFHGILFVSGRVFSPFFVKRNRKQILQRYKANILTNHGMYVIYFNTLDCYVEFDFLCLCLVLIWKDQYKEVSHWYYHEENYCKYFNTLEQKKEVNHWLLLLHLYLVTNCQYTHLM